MNLAQVARILSGFVLFISLYQAIPFTVAIFEARRDGIDAVAGFGAAMGIGGIVALLLFLAGRGGTQTDFFRKEGLAAVAFAWVMAAALGAIPFVWSGSVPSAADAFFETTRGLTTTGASVFGSGEG